jgi:hypothetical protein
MLLIVGYNIDIVNNIIYETCKIGKMSNGTYIDNRFGNFSQSVSNYCLNFNSTCILNIYKDVRDTAEEMRKNYDIFFAKPTSSILKKWKETIEESSRDSLEEYIRTYEFIGKRKTRR